MPPCLTPLPIEKQEDTIPYQHTLTVWWLYISNRWNRWKRRLSL